MRKFIAAFLILGFVAAAFAAKAPTHRSMRGESMGNAHVALVDDKEASRRLTVWATTRSAPNKVTTRATSSAMRA